MLEPSAACTSPPSTVRVSPTTQSPARLALGALGHEALGDHAADAPRPAVTRAMRPSSENSSETSMRGSGWGQENNGSGRYNARPRKGIRQPVHGEMAEWTKARPC